MSQSSICNNCGLTVIAHGKDGNKALFHCPCGHKWGSKKGTTLIGSDTTPCHKCKGTGYSIGVNGNIKGYKCRNCNSFWTKRI